MSTPVTVWVPSHWKVKSLLIGELSERSNVPAKTLRFYEDVGVLPPPARTSSGYRDYDNSALDRLRFIASAQGAGLSLAEIREVIGIRDEGGIPCAHRSDEHTYELPSLMRLSYADFSLQKKK